MFGWFRKERTGSYSKALASQRVVIAQLMERNEALAIENGRLKATVEMQFRDLAQVTAQVNALATPAPPPPAPKSPLLGQLNALGGSDADDATPAKPKPPAEPPPRVRHFSNMAVSGGHIRPVPPIKAVKA